MKLQKAAEAVIRQLAKLEILSGGESAEADALVSRGQAADAFRFIRHICSSTRYVIGWNKVWDGQVMRCWYGTLTLDLPLRAIALEIESDAVVWEAARALLQRWSFGGHPEPQGSEEQTVRNSLDNLGITLTSGDFVVAARRLLQRLNLDTRELPLVERWRWSENNGLAMLSDGGRFHIRSEVVWARAVETAIGVTGGISESLKAILRDIDSNGTSIVLSNAETHTEWALVCDILQFYGFGRRLSDEMLLSAPAGDFPRLAADLWG